MDEYGEGKRKREKEIDEETDSEEKVPSLSTPEHSRLSAASSEEFLCECCLISDSYTTYVLLLKPVILE